jgi:hypothetical protein
MMPQGGLNELTKISCSLIRLLGGCRRERVDRIQSITAQPFVKDPPCDFVLNPKTESIKYEPTVIIKTKTVY